MQKWCNSFGQKNHDRHEHESGARIERIARQCERALIYERRGVRFGVDDDGAGEQCRTPDT